MKQLFYFLSFSIVLVSCSETETANNDVVVNSDSLITDSTLVENLIQIEVDPDRIEINVEELLSKTEQEFELPLLIDSLFIDDNAIIGEDADYNLTYQEVRYLGFEFPDGDLVNSATWNIETFAKLDSLKTNGGYEEYQKNIDLGQARYSIAEVIGKVNINPQSTLILWNINYATYEACPWGSGTYIFGTVFTNGVGTNTCLLAEKSAGGDPPSWGETYVQSEISDSTITTFCSDTWGEYGYDGEDDLIETQKRTELVKVNSYGFKVTKKGGGFIY